MESFLGIRSLDVRIGLRLLARYPVLTVAGTAAIAFAIALGTIYFEAIDKFQHPRLPIRGADRVVSVHQWDVERFGAEQRLLHDFAAWRGQSRAIELLGASITFERNLTTADKRVEPVVGAELTPNAFDLMGARPVLGRTLTDRDANPAEPLVIVLSHRLWAGRFDRDASVLGQTVMLGSTAATIVGVMPEGFGFPVNHQAWVPLRIDGSTLAPRTGPTASVFGRLAPGRTIDDANAELAVLNARVASESPATHQTLRPRVLPYGAPLNEGGEMRMIRNVMYSVNAIFLMLLAVMCANVATLVFARTATRSWELTVRTALGASRRRIVGQLFVEALVLSSLAAIVGLVVAKVALGVGVSWFAQSGALPFWINADLSWRTILYVGALTLVGAAIVGILPAIRVTRVNIQEALRSESAGTASLRFGGFWTAMLIVQVAITVLFIPLAAGGVFESNRFQQRAEGIGAHRFMTATVAMDREEYGLDAAAHAARARNAFEELERRLLAEPGVEGVAFADRLPVEDQFKYRIAVDTVPGEPATSLRRSTLVHVSRGFFDTFGSTVVAGRGFEPLDFDAGNVLLVNQSFAQHVFGGRNPVGRRVQILGGEVDAVGGDTWYEIVGMVRDFGWQLPRPEEQSAMYLPSRPITGYASQLAVRTASPDSVAARLRAVAVAVDPTIRLTDLTVLGNAGAGEARGNWTLTVIAWLLVSFVMMLSAMGIHALMSFTVARRTREIGIRVALGAGARDIIRGIFSRAFLQVGSGLALGSAISILVSGIASTRHLVLLVSANALMLLVGLIACALPLRHALRIEPTEALRSEG